MMPRSKSNKPAAPIAESIIRTAIITDSSSGITENPDLGIFVMPIPILVDGEIYYEGRNITHDQLFCYLERNRKVSTFPPSSARILETWNRVLRAGYHELVYIPLSGGLSSTCAISQVLALSYENQVEVVDNRCISVTQRHSVENAVALRSLGFSARQIREELEALSNDSSILVCVNTLEMLKSSGKITSAGAALEPTSNFKPILSLRDDRLDAYQRARGYKNCRTQLIEAMQKRAEVFRKNNFPIKLSAAGSFTSQYSAKEWKKAVQSAFPMYDVCYCPLSVGICCHIGANAFGIGISRGVCSSTICMQEDLS